MPTFDQVTLEHLIKRLLPKVGSVTGAQLYRHPEKWRGPRGRWAQALIRAQSALASGDDEQIRLAALFCLQLERDGRDEIERAARRKGRERAARVRTDESDGARARAKYDPIFQAALQSGQTAKAAHNTVRSAMLRDEFAMKKSGLMPDRRTLLRWFPNPPYNGGATPTVK